MEKTAQIIDGKFIKILEELNEIDIIFNQTIVPFLKLGDSTTSLAMLSHHKEHVENVTSLREAIAKTVDFWDEVYKEKVMEVS